MKINFKQPKYVLPLILLPFLCLCFYVWHSGSGKTGKIVAEKNGLNRNVGDVSSDVRKKELADKLDAYRNKYKETGGFTAVAAIPHENSTDPGFHEDASDIQRRRLDSLQKLIKGRNIRPVRNDGGRDVARAINEMSRRQSAAGTPPAAEKDPMEMFKQQLAYMDSVNKVNDPAYKSEKLKREAAEKLAREKASEVKLDVSKVDGPSADFNTVLPEKSPSFISALIDENVTGYAGSRLRLRLMEDIKAGNYLVKKGTYLYAMISGFSEQRVTLKITSILFAGKILPVKLDVYDLDGQPGLYVPASAFRDFTKDLGGNSVQGVTIDNGSTSFLMSSVDKVFQSSSSAIADIIRKNKAKLKYNTCVYLIDNDALQKEQKAY